MDFSDTIEAIQSGGILALLVLVVYGGMKRWWYWSHQYDDMKKEMNSQIEECKKREIWWRSVALSSLDISEKIVKGEKNE